MKIIIIISNNDLDSFQNGVDIISSKCTSCGSTPTTNTPNDISISIDNIYNNRYNDGKVAPSTYVLATHGIWCDHENSITGQQITFTGTDKKWLCLCSYSAHHNGGDSPASFDVYGGSVKTVYDQIAHSSNSIMQNRLSVKEVITSGASVTITCVFNIGNYEHHYNTLYMAIICVR